MVAIEIPEPISQYLVVTADYHHFFKPHVLYNPPILRIEAAYLFFKAPKTSANLSGELAQNSSILCGRVETTQTPTGERFFFCAATADKGCLENGKQSRHVLVPGRDVSKGGERRRRIWDRRAIKQSKNGVQLHLLTTRLADLLAGAVCSCTC